MTTVSHDVLVVVPDKALLDLIGDLVVSLGHRPILLSSQKGALEECSKNKSIAVMIIDWEISEWIFPGIINQINEVSPHMGKLVWSNANYPEIRKMVEDGTFCCYTVKPVIIEDFEKVLKSCIRKYEDRVKKS